MTNVAVPRRLLLETAISVTAKLVWMLLRFKGDITTGQLQVTSGLAATTIRRAVTELQGAGWLGTQGAGWLGTPGAGWLGTPGAGGRGTQSAVWLGTPGAGGRGTQSAGGLPIQGAARHMVLVPAELLLDTRVKTTGKLLYAILQCSPDLAISAGRFTYSTLAARAGLSVNPVKAAVLRLHQAGWLQVAKSNKFRPIHFTLRNPADERYRRAAAGIERRMGKAEHKGEALMREYLSLIIASDHYDDDASPGFLVNPYTGVELQLDRYYPPSVAFEFQGAQHFGPTKHYPDEDEARKLQARDHMKAGICNREHIELVLIRPEDLSLNVLREKVPALLPQRDLAGAERVIANLDRRSRSYRAEAKKA